MKENDCLTVVCENGGVCEPGSICRDSNNSKLSINRDWSCKCRPGFSGRHCEMRVDLCRGFPCANGGTCLDSNGIDFTCACAPGFTGKHCSIDINECDPNPCLNNGLCHDRVDEFTCSCPPGFSGTICQFSSNFTRPVSSQDSLPSAGNQVPSSAFSSVNEDNDKVYVISGVILAPLIVITIVLLFVIWRKRLQEKDRRRDKQLARSQNEANSRSLMKKKCLDNDPFKGQMIVNSLTDDTASSIHGYSTASSLNSHYNLNRNKSLALSKSMTKLTNYDYECNLKLAASAKQSFSKQEEYGKVSLNPSCSSESSSPVSCKKQGKGVEHKSQEVVRFPPHTLHRINCPRKGLNHHPDPDVVRCGQIQQQHHHQHVHHPHHHHHHQHGLYTQAQSMTRLNVLKDYPGVQNQFRAGLQPSIFDNKQAFIV